MKIATNIAGGLLGLAFIAFSIMFLFKLVPMDLPPDATPATKHFMEAFGPTGYMTFVKILELLGGILVAIPVTRNFGLLILGPIIINILAFDILVAKGPDPVIIVISLLAAFLLWSARGKFLALKN